MWDSDTHRLFDAPINATIHFHVWAFDVSTMQFASGWHCEPFVFVFSVDDWKPQHKFMDGIRCGRFDVPSDVGPNDWVPLVTPYLFIFYCLTSHARWPGGSPPLNFHLETELLNRNSSFIDFDFEVIAVSIEYSFQLFPREQWVDRVMGIIIIQRHVDNRPDSTKADLRHFAI